MKYNRLVQQKIEQSLTDKKIIILYGARQVGKTTLIKNILKKYKKKSVYIDFEDPENRMQFENQGITKLKMLLQDIDLVVFDEAQKLLNISQTLKLIHDHIPDTRIIATGSSSFDLSNQITEPLTGRTITYTLFPISIQELSRTTTNFDLIKQISNYLRFGLYPEIIDLSDNKSDIYLKELSKSYLFKDVFKFQDLRNPELLDKLFRAIALQLGNEVSYHELANTLGVNSETIEKYIQLLEKAFVIFRLTSFSQNPRKEISKKRKIYFYDLGIRNSLIKNTNELNIRNDVGFLWENFCIVERLKMLSYKEQSPNIYFWRTYTQKEIDYIEENHNFLKTFEFKWSSNKKPKIPKGFKDQYPKSSFEQITPNNFLSFVK